MFQLLIRALDDRTATIWPSACNSGVDWVALSSCAPSGIAGDPRCINRPRPHTPVDRQVEKFEAIVQIVSLFAPLWTASWWRGDLGVEMPARGVPMLQKD